MRGGCEGGECGVDRLEAALLVLLQSINRNRLRPRLKHSRLLIGVVDSTRTIVRRRA